VAALGLSLAALKYAVFSAILITLLATDLEERILPDEFTLGGAVVGLVLAAVVPIESGIVVFFLSRDLGLRLASVAEAFLSALAAGGGIWLIGWLYQKARHREGMGFGDVKMIAMIGAFLGFQETLLTLILASVLGSVTGVAYVLITKKDMSTYELPFGSFIGLAGLAVALWGHVVKVL
jgi:leader peptidase (prepilin peptidase)/N-methyltransferase